MNKPKLHTAIQIVIIPLVKTDINKLEQILMAHVRDITTKELLDDEIQEIKGYMNGRKDDYGRDRRYLVAKDVTGKVLGCMAYSFPDPDMIKHFHLDNKESNIELLNAFVSPDVFRGGGVGRKLLEAICDARRKIGKKQLLIHSGPRYQDSWGFYDKTTDETCGFIENKYGNGRHAKTWRKRLFSI